MEQTILNTYEVRLNCGSAVIYRRHKYYAIRKYRSCVTYRIMALLDDGTEYSFIGSSIPDVLSVLKDVANCEVIDVIKVK